MLIDPTDIEWALRTVRREARDQGTVPVWSDADWTDVLNESAFGDPLKPLYDPYFAAIGFLLDPANLASRKLGDVTEVFVDPAALSGRLMALSERHRAQYGPVTGPIFTLWGP